MKTMVIPYPMEKMREKRGGISTASGDYFSPTIRYCKRSWAPHPPAETFLKKQRDMLNYLFKVAKYGEET